MPAIEPSEKLLFDTPVEKPLTCKWCGHTGPEVHTHFRYIGGKGYQSTPPECDELSECLERQGASRGS